MDIVKLVITVTVMTAFWHYLQKKTGYLTQIEKRVNNKFVYNFVVSCLILACFIPFMSKMNKAIFWALAVSTINAFILRKKK